MVFKTTTTSTALSLRLRHPRAGETPQQSRAHTALIPLTPSSRDLTSPASWSMFTHLYICVHAQINKINQGHLFWPLIALLIASMQVETCSLCEALVSWGEPSHSAVVAVTVVHIHTPAALEEQQTSLQSTSFSGSLISFWNLDNPSSSFCP